MSLFKRLKKFIKKLVRFIKYKINPKSLSKKDRKTVEKRIEDLSRYSWRGNLLRLFTGTLDLKVKAA